MYATAFYLSTKNRFSSQKGILIRCSPTSSLQHHMQLLQAEQFAEWIRLDGVQSHPTEIFHGWRKFWARAEVSPA